ncbi:MAG TPA: DNA-binding protein WhiA [Candidatus Coproplasma excrementigallinarum]|uniref:Probable cell division protein WhiA n=1 Tax=Candidatus Coproplasma excrementigallinarum TaxID=2840747 RepID=A0A9D1SJL8_9FIRM|nr:DNA-binding protein WhiA [Candidatus Coproplasma excrementigallinarum]
MLNFTEEIKNEIIKNFSGGRQNVLAALSAFIRTSGSLIRSGGDYGFELSTESEHTAHFFAELIESAFGIEISEFSSRSDISSGRDKLIFSCVGESSTRLLLEMGILGEDEEGLFVSFSSSASSNDRASAEAYIKGAFLGGGSCTLPDSKSVSSTGYHLEVVFHNKITAGDFADLLCNFDIFPKLVMRKESAVVYLKSIEAISAFLGVADAKNALSKLDEVARERDAANNENRVNNCSVSNIDRTVSASVKQVQAIEIIRSTIGLQSLDENLFSVAEGRLADKNASMQELADRLKISKSCLNHRFRKIMDMARQLGDG